MSRRRDGLPSVVIEEDFFECEHCPKECRAGRRLAVKQVEARGRIRERQRCGEFLEEGLSRLGPYLKREKEIEIMRVVEYLVSNIMFPREPSRE